MRSSSVGGGGVIEDESSVSDRILDAVAGEEGASPVEFDPLLPEVIDPDALKRVFRDEDRDGKGTISYLGYRVEVRADGQVSVREQ